MSEDVHETNNVVPTDPPVPRVLAPVPTPEPTVNPAAPPSDAGDWSDKCVCGWRTEDLREDSNFWGQVDFPSPKTATDFFVCPKCNRVLRTYMKSMRRGM